MNEDRAATEPSTENGTSAVVGRTETFAVVSILLLTQTSMLSGCNSEPTCSARPRIVYDSAFPTCCDSQARSAIVGTYNLQGLHDPDGIASALAALDFVDIWAFQEVNCTIASDSDRPAVFVEHDPPERLVSVLPGHGWHVFYVLLNPVRGGGEMEGLAIASRHVLSEKNVWPLRAVGRKRRGALSCRVSLDGVDVLVINTDHEVGLLAIGPSDRQLQVDDLKAHIASSSVRRGGPLILLGDFNTVGRSLIPRGMTSVEEVRQLRMSLLPLGIRSLPGSGEPCNTFRRLLWSRPLDHIFMRGLQCRRWGTTEGYPGSDHRPLWAVAQLDNGSVQPKAATPPPSPR